MSSASQLNNKQEEAMKYTQGPFIGLLALVQVKHR